VGFVWRGAWRWLGGERDSRGAREDRRSADPSRLLGPILATSLNLSLASVFPLQGLGYTAEDSAGQSNIFAVEPKTYVAGSAKDPKAGSGSFVYAMTAGVIGAAAIAAGVSLTAQESRMFFSFLSFFPHRARLPSA